MEYRTLQEIVEENGSIIWVDQFLDIVIAWGGEGRFNVFRETQPNQYEETDTFYIGIEETMNIRWAKRKAQEWLQYIQEEELA